ncbi:MAG: hypothetical protein U9N46_08190 [Euryarchaeota archaeon]|nr:hypothetical protein [Euryarchaeota archaeon]
MGTRTMDRSGTHSERGENFSDAAQQSPGRKYRKTDLEAVPQRRVPGDFEIDLE